MALMYCRECGQRVSSEAPHCPHCGVPAPVLLPNGLPASRGAFALVRPRKDPTVAGLLSFFIPGAGQMYRGKVGAGIGWMVAVMIGYMAIIVPGLVLHGLCVYNATREDYAF